MDRILAKCRKCHSVFDFSSQIQSSGKNKNAKSKDRMPVPMPPGIKTQFDGLNWIITRRWYSHKFIFLVFFCVVWNLFLFGWYSTALYGFDEGVDLIAILFPIGHVAVGVGLTYYTIAGFLNKTTITISRQNLRVKHTPIPWRGNHNIESAKLEQLYCIEKKHKNKNGSNYSYQVHAVLCDGKSFKFLSGLEEPEQALYIEQEIETRLKIKDRFVTGEYSP